jgi:hypothetical protein
MLENSVFWAAGRPGESREMKHANTSGQRHYPVGWFRALCPAAFLLFFCNGPAVAKEPDFKVMAFYSTDVERDHVHVADDALVFFRELATKDNFTFDATTDWGKLNEKDLKQYQLILWLNNFPQTLEQRAAFEKYMEQGGAWLVCTSLVTTTHRQSGRGL